MLTQQTVTVTGINAFPAITAPQIDVGFLPRTWRFRMSKATVADATAFIEISFDGVNVHETLDSSHNNSTWSSEECGNAQKIWVKSSAGATAVLIVNGGK